MNVSDYIDFQMLLRERPAWNMRYGYDKELHSHHIILLGDFFDKNEFGDCISGGCEVRICQGGRAAMMENHPSFEPVSNTSFGIMGFSSDLKPRGDGQYGPYGDAAIIANIYLSREVFVDAVQVCGGVLSEGYKVGFNASVLSVNIPWNNITAHRWTTHPAIPVEVDFSKPLIVEVVGVSLYRSSELL